jgi:hypothetical protein
MTVPRFGHTATLLADGRVLVTGGTNYGAQRSSRLGHAQELASAEVYDPASGKFSLTGSMTLARSSHSATALGNGMVLVAAGVWAPYPLPPCQGTSAEIYDPVTGMFARTGDMTIWMRTQTATLLPNGTVLMVGGSDPASHALAAADLFDPNALTFTAAGRMGTTRFGHTATALPDGTVLVTGGGGGENAGDPVPLASAELYR